MRVIARHAAALAVATWTLGCGNVPGTGIADDGSGSRSDGGGVSDGRSPDATVPTVPPEVDGRVTINELMASNAVTLHDESGAAGDWIELYNPTDQDLSLHGYALTDQLSDPHKSPLDGVIISAGGHLVLWADDRSDVGATHLAFKLDARAGELGLARPDGTYIDRIRYGEQAVDFASARTPDGSDRWQTVWNVTPRAANGAGAGTAMGLEIASAPPEDVPPAGDLSEQVLGYDEMPELELLVSAEAAASLELQPFVDVPAQLVFRGRSYGPVGLRLKGQNSFLPFSAKPSFRINVDEYVDKARFWGLKDLTLNNMSGDLSMMHERLGYWVMRHSGVPASRANHTRITVNGQSFGLYSNVETVKRPMMGRWFADDSGPLFEATDVDFVSNDVPRYELESGPDDRTLLTGLAAALSVPSADAAITAAGDFADMARFRRFWAVASVIGQFDSFPYSDPGDDYFVYADPVSQRLAFLPWGMDETFYSGAVDVVTTTHSVLAQRCKESPACFEAYVTETWAVVALTEQLGLAAERDRVIAQIAPYVAMDTRKPYTDQQVLDSQAALYWFIAERRTHLSAMLTAP